MPRSRKCTGTNFTFFYINKGLEYGRALDFCQRGKLVKLLFGLSPIITYAFRDFSQSLQENVHINPSSRRQTPTLEYFPMYQSTSMIEFDVQQPGITVSDVKRTIKKRDRDVTGTLANMTPHITVVIRRAVHITFISLKCRKFTRNRSGVKKYTCTPIKGFQPDPPSKMYKLYASKLIVSESGIFPYTLSKRIIRGASYYVRLFIRNCSKIP